MNVQLHESNIDLESMNDLELKTLGKAISDIDLENGYNRADLESIETIVPGLFTDLEEFRFEEFPSTPSRVNAGLVSRKLDEVRQAIASSLNTRYKQYLEMYGTALSKVMKIQQILSSIKHITPNPILENSSMVAFYNNMLFDHYTLSEIVFSDLHSIPRQLREVSDINLNTEIRKFNMRMSILEPAVEGNKEYSCHIIKEAMGVSKVTYDTILDIFGDHSKLESYMETFLSEALKALSDMKSDLESMGWLNNSYIERWVSSSSRLRMIRPIANDNTTIDLLITLAYFRYKDIEL